MEVFFSEKITTVIAHDKDKYISYIKDNNIFILSDFF